MSLNFPENRPSLTFAPSVTARPRSSLPSLNSVVRPVSPIRLETLDGGKSTEERKTGVSRPRSAILSPINDHFALSTKKLGPFPPSFSKSSKPSSLKKRTQLAATSYVQPRKSPEPGGPYLLAVVGKPVGKADKTVSHIQSDEKSNHSLVEEKVRMKL